MAFDYIWLTDKLEGEYKEAFDKVEIYANLRNVDEDAQSDMMMELLDLFLTAQNEGKPVKKLIGPDLEKFCNSYFSSYTWNSYVRSIPKKIYRLSWIVLVIELILYFVSEEDFSLLHGTADISGYICGMLVGGLCAFLCNLLIRPFVFRWKWLTSGRFSAFVLILTIGMIIAGVVLLDGRALEVPLFPVLVISGIYILVYIIIRSIWRYRSYGSIRKEKPVGERGFRSMIKELLDEMPEELVRQFHNKNAKRQKKGKEPMTPEEYMEFLHKGNIQARRADWIGPLIVLLVVVGTIVQTALTSTLFDTLIFSVVLIIIEIPTMALFRVGRRSTAEREKLVAECERRGITIFEYVEEREKGEGV